MFTGNISNDLSHFPILNMTHHGYNYRDILIPIYLKGIHG